ncbi:Initiator Replication protein [Bacteroides sp. AR20]|nr:replication initiation protein [Bacteroides sp. AR20]SEO66811.1 Initiator Replication protein [Bacteroides sp. AR20]
MADKNYSLQYDPTYRVATANDLIKGRQKMSLREAQLLFIAIAQVVHDDKDFKTYTTTVPELATFMEIDENSLYRDLEGICTSLCSQVVKIQVGGENAKKGKKWKIFHWVSSAMYDNGKLTLRLSDDIKPYLLELEAHYAQPFLGTLMTFRSYYATRLYQYLLADIGAKWGKIYEWNFTCEQLRDLFQPYVKDDKGNVIKELYPRNYDLVRFTIKPALEELGASDFAYVWDYEEHRAKTRGRPLQSVSFKAILFENKEKKDFYLKRVKPFAAQYNAERSAAIATQEPAGADKKEEYEQIAFTGCEGMTEPIDKE